jgi:hypothetical protein
VSVIEGIDCLPPILSTELPKRSTTREVLSEAVVADLGESWNPSPHLIVRHRTFYFTSLAPDLGSHTDFLGSYALKATSL